MGFPPDDEADDDRREETCAPGGFARPRAPARPPTTVFAQTLRPPPGTAVPPAPASPTALTAFASPATDAPEEGNALATSRRKTADERAAARKRKSKERAERRKSRATAAAGKRKQKQKKSRRGAEPAERSHGESSESPDAAGESVALPAQSGRPGGLTVAVLVLIAVIFALALFVAALVTKAG